MQLTGKTFVLGIGAQRSGTTWLHDYLSGHSEVCASPLKEMHFFDTHLGPQFSRERWVARFQLSRSRLAERPAGPERQDRIEALEERINMHDDPKRYFTFFARRAGDKPVLCEITPSYSLLSVDQFKWVRDFFASSGAVLKLIFVMRDPVDRHQSFFNYRQRNGSETGDFIRSLSSSDALARGRYDVVLESVRAVFSPEQIITGFYESIFSDPDVHLKRLMDNIGIEYIAPNVREKVNSALSRDKALSDAELSAAMAKFAPVYEYVNREFASSKPSNWRA